MAFPSQPNQAPIPPSNQPSNETASAIAHLATPSTATQKATQPLLVPHARKSHRWLRRGSVGILILGLIGFTAPQWLMATGLGRWVLEGQLATPPAQVRLGRVTLNWWRPVVLHQIHVAEPDNTPILEVAEARTTHTLWQIVCNPADWGNLEIDRTKMQIVVRGDQHNLACLLAPASDPAPSEPPAPILGGAVAKIILTNTDVVLIQEFPSKVPTTDLEIADSEIAEPVKAAVESATTRSAATHSATNNRRWQFQIPHIDWTVARPGNPGDRIELTAQLINQSLNNQTTTFAAAGISPSIHVVWDSSTYSLHSDWQYLPLELLNLLELQPAKESFAGTASGSIQFLVQAAANPSTTVSHEPGHFTFQCKCTTENLQVPPTLWAMPADPNEKIIPFSQDPAMTLPETFTCTMVADGQLQPSGNLGALHSARLDYQDADGAWSVSLTPNKPTVHSESAPATVETSGSTLSFPIHLQTLVRVAQRFVPELQDLQLHGKGQLQAALVLEGSKIRLAPLQIDLQDFLVDYGGSGILQPQAHLTAQLIYDWDKNELQMESGALTTTSLQINANSCVCSLAEAGTLVSQGQCKVVGEWELIQLWLRGALAETARSFGGDIQAELDWHMLVAETRLDLTVAGQQLRFGPIAQPAWSEPWGKAAAKVVYEPAVGRLRFDAIAAATPLVTVQGQGAIADLFGVGNLKLQGTTQYHWPAIQSLLQTKLDPEATITGSVQQPFAVTGDLFPQVANQVTTVQVLKPSNPNWTPEATLPPGANTSEMASSSTMSLGWMIDGGFGWDAANLFGVELGQALVHTQWQHNQLLFDPVVCSANGGTVRLLPLLASASNDLWLQHAPGLILDQVQITPAMTNRFLRYATPMLADAGQIQGRVSLHLEHCAIPMSQLALGQAAGKLELIEVALQGGTIIEEIARLLNRPPQVRVLRDSQVSLQWHQQRVHHQGLVLLFSDLRVETAGSIGLDQSLDLNVTIPMPTHLIRSQGIAKVLQDQKVTLHIGGTLTHPILDKRNLKQEGVEVIKETGKRLLENQLQKLLK